jgi:hypothetical protein
MRVQAPPPAPLFPMLLASEIDNEEVIVTTGSRVLLVLTLHRNHRLIE